MGSNQPRRVGSLLPRVRPSARRRPPKRHNSPHMPALLPLVLRRSLALHLSLISPFRPFSTSFCPRRFTTRCLSERFSPQPPSPPGR
ncbi:hypothetical protein CLOP_g8968 [Closterium sp. NIES-67]|nr:hypothetical protein CLOP_g8968 [Closterium sp. NIES-67]